MFRSILFKLLVAVFVLFLLITLGLTVTINGQFSDFIDVEEKNYRQELTDDHFKHLLKTVVDNAYQIIETLHTTYPNNPEKAQVEARKILSAIRYQSDSGYLFAYAAKPDGYYFAFHGTKKKNNGIKISPQDPDVKGFAFRQALIDNAKANNGKFTRYYYEKPTTKQIIPKLAYSRLFTPWNWTIVTGVYVDDIDKKVANKVKTLQKQSDQFFTSLVLVNFIGGILFTIIFIFLGRYLILTPLKQMATALKNLHSSDDITAIQKLNEGRTDELGTLTVHVNKTIDKFMALFYTLKEKLILLGDVSQEITQQTYTLGSASETIKDESGALNSTSSILLQDTAIMVKNISNALQKLTEVTSISVGVKGDMNNASGAIKEVSEHLLSIATAMEEMLATIKEIAKTTLRTDYVVRAVEEKSNSLESKISILNQNALEINAITGLIKQISAQTNLLALNATIEAARAGDAGKGFAVVANEVKNLANETASATMKIETQIESLQGISQDAVGMISEINQTMDEMRGAMETIASSIQEQEATTSEISTLMQQNSDSITQISGNIVNVNQSTIDLSALITDSQHEISDVTDKVNTIQVQAETVATSGQNLNQQVDALDKINSDLGKRSNDLASWATEIKELL